MHFIFGPYILAVVGQVCLFCWIPSTCSATTTAQRSPDSRARVVPLFSRRVRIDRRVDSGSNFGKFGAPRGSPSCSASTQCTPVDACTMPTALSAFDPETARTQMGLMHAPCSLDPLDYPEASAKGEDGICCPLVKTCPELKACRPPTTCDSAGEALPKKAPKNKDLEFNVPLTKCEPPKRILQGNPNAFGFCCSTIASQLNAKEPDPMAEKRLDRDTFGLRLASKSRIREQVRMRRRRRHDSRKQQQSDHDAENQA